MTYSKFDGFISVQRIVEKTKELGIPAVGLTDHGTVAGIIDFLRTCRKEGVKPILGTEAYLARDHTCHSKKGQPDLQKGNKHLLLIAKNYKGYQNLCRLSQISSLKGTYYSPRIDMNLLAEHSEGLIVSSACLKGLINWNLIIDRYDKAKKAASIFKDIFGDDFYLEVMYHGIEKEAKIIPEIYRLGKDLDIKVIATNDVHYENQSDGDAHEVVMCMSSGRYITDPNRNRYKHHELYYKTPEEMYKIFGHVPSVLKNTLEIAEKCDYSDIVFTDEGGQMRLPDFKFPEEYSNPHKYLSKLAFGGLEELNLHTSQEHVDRLDLELSDIKLIYDRKGYDFSTYFLIVHDMYDWAKKQKIPCGIRGSGYSSLLLYCLKLSELDPLSYDLYWERFMSVDRVGWPDIDMDFCCIRRHEIIEYLREKYGEDRVAPIGTVQTLKTKAAIRKVIKVLDPTKSIRFDERGKAIKTSKNENFELENEILDTLPKTQKLFREDGTEVKSVEEAYYEFPTFKQYMDAYPDIYKYAKEVEKTMSAYGQHPAGIVLSPEPVNGICPLHVTTGVDITEDTKSGKVLATQYTMNYVEAMGLIKFDVLGLSTETALAEAEIRIKENHNIDVDLLNVPLEDKKSLEIFNNGLTDGIFQCENFGMKEALRAIGVQSFDDIVLTIAMYRPGPKDYIPEMAEKKKGIRSVQYPHKAMKQITEMTQGIICYQEQVMRVFTDLAGLSRSDGYLFQKGCAKKNKDLIKRYKEPFFSGAINNGVDEKVVKKIWKDMEKFSKYAFNKSLSFSEKIRTCKKDYTIQKLYSMRCKGESLPRVYAPDGQEIDIVDIYDHGILPVFEVVFSDGSVHKCTMNHKFLTDCGISPLHEILEHDLCVIINGDIKNATKKRLDMFGMQRYNQESNIIPKTQKKMFSVSKTKIETLYMPGLSDNDCRKKEICRTQKKMSQMEKTKISALQHTKQTKFEETMGKIVCKRSFNDIIQRECKQSCIQSYYEKSPRKKTPFKTNENLMGKTRRSFSENFIKNSEENVFSSGNITKKIRTTKKMEREISKRILSKMYKKNARIKKEKKGVGHIPFRTRKVFANNTFSNRFSLLSSDKKQKVSNKIKTKTNRFYRSCSQSSGGIRRSTTFQGRLWSNCRRTAKERQNFGYSFMSKRIFGYTDFLRYLDLQEKKIQIQRDRSINNSCDDIYGTRNCENYRQKVRVIKCKFVGFEQCYDLHVNSQDHLYCLSSGIITQNSHSVSYALKGMKCAYLKAHYPIEFMASRLSVETRRKRFVAMARYEKDCIRNLGIKILDPELNLSKVDWVVCEEEYALRKPLLAKGIGEKAAEEMVKHQPYRGKDILLSFADSTGQAVNSKTIEAMCEAGMWKGMGKSKAAIIRDFKKIRDDRRKGRGHQQGDLFE